MPQIKEYKMRSEVQGPVQGRLARTEDFSFNRGLQDLGDAASEVGQMVQKRQEQADISNLNAEFSKAQSEMTVQLKEELRTAKPGDSTITQRFMEGYDSYMNKLSESVATGKGRQYFSQASADLKGHFLQSASIGQADLAGVKAKNDYVSSLNNFSSTLVNDPSSFELTRQMHMVGIENLVQTGSLPSAYAEELKLTGQLQLAKSAVRGWIDTNPTIAKRQLSEGKWDTFIDGDTKVSLMREADQALRGDEIEYNRRLKEQKEALRAAQYETQQQFLEKFKENKLTSKDVLNSNLDPFGKGSKQQFLNMLDRGNKAAKIRTNPSTMNALFERIHLPDDDPKKIFDENDLNEYFGKGLDMTSLNQLRAEVQGRRTTDGKIEADLKKGLLNTAKSRLTKSNGLAGIKDPIGDEQYQKFMSSFLKEYSEKRKQGKSPEQLLNPESTDYLGKNINNYVRSTDQIIRDMVGGIKAPNEIPTPVEATTPPDPAKARQEGESMNDYLKRRGLK